ncbi:DMT family transporter [Amorphus orientalis]|uniref:Drug/metabolite transporter (DMT)-like permease n=1 Tax=Amorphus orientalis TaxID=649198 RepID=A0AAE3VLT5_9HYPH|nr:DMT family transporter [Amorphus orientalis]MDQ0314345.1 drug/metabolite transporter (DMT)-like permease [Amorphus orientalis]
MSGHGSASRPGHRAAGDDNLTLAVLTIVGTVAALSFGDAVIKLISADFLLWQIFVLRSLLAIPVLGAIGLMRRGTGLGALRIRRPLWTGLRSLLLVAMWVVYYASLPHLKLSIAASAYYTLPIFIVLFSAVLMKERISAIGWIAVGLGFAGVVLILDPNADDFNAFVLLPLVSAVFYALAMILTRTRCRDEHPLALSLALNLAFVAAGVLGSALVGLDGSGGSGYLVGAWTPMGASQWAAMIVLAATVVVASVGTAVAYQVGRPSVVASFDFAYVGFAVIWGVLIFGEVPEPQAAVGIVLVVAAGLLAVRRRTQAGRD